MSELTLVNLSALLETFYEASVKTSKSEPPSIELKKIYFEILKDLDFEEVSKNGFENFKTNKYFPAACDLRADTDKHLDLEAQKAWEILDRALDYYAPGFGCSCDIVELKLIEWKRADLIPFFHRWGREIVNDTNPSATRAQFLKAYKADIENRRLEIGSGEKTKLPKKVDLLLDDIGKKI